MLEYDRTDKSEGIDSTRNKLVSRECWLCGFWYYLDKNFKYERYWCDGCHDMSARAVSMHNLAVIYVKGNAYRINFAFMTKDEAYIKMHNAVLKDKRGTL